MSRDQYDIPEVFRRAMEENGWMDRDSDKQGGDGGGDDGGNGRRPSWPPAGGGWWRNRTVWIIGLFLILFLSLSWIVDTYTDWLWFTELNYQNVWLRQWGIQVITFIIGFILAGAILLGNWHIARRRAMRGTPPFNPNILEFGGIKWLINGLGLFLTFGFASSAAARWESFLLYFNRVAYGTADPIFNRDVSFYLFELPVYDFVQGWFLSLLVMTLIGVVVLYAANYFPDIQRGRWQPQQVPVLRQHAALIGAIILGLWAAGYWFNIYELLYSSQGVVFGASYTDLNASLWALRAQLILMALTAVAVGINIFRLSLRPAAATAGLWLAATVLLGGLYPGLLQRYSVEPNEIVRESPYIDHNIKFTRLAFNLDEINSAQFELGQELTESDLDEHRLALQNVRLWDYRPLQDTYDQLQTLRPYYQFSEVDIDRYEIDGQLRQVMLAARELNKENLPSRTWVNQNLEFTHGYGIVMNPVNEVSPEGRPEFFIQDLPPQTVIPIELNQPEIYYGEMTTDVVFVGSNREEFSYPSGDVNVRTSYAGEGGVPLDNALKRIAFALRLGDANVLLSDDITPDTRVQFHRQITNRVGQIAPFLELDNDPYMVVWNGRLVWMIDAYTISNRFPYATPLENGINYIRNSVKITVDAYDGTVTFYIADEADPIIQAYAGAFPGLFQPLEAMPEGLQNHIRYPVDLFIAQTLQYRKYHMADVRVFYNQEDLWELPTELFDGEEQLMEPYYVTLELPDSDLLEYLLIQPYTPAGKDNMIAWFAARNDPPNYGELVVYELPKQELVFGPIQVESRIDQEPTISQQFSLWNQQGSRVIRGNLIVIPLNDSFLYVEPVYLRSETSALPELKRVIVATESRIIMEETLDEALTNLVAGVGVVELTPPDEDTATAAAEESDEPAAEEGETAVPVDATVEELILSANQHFEAAEAAQRDGDWTTYGVELEALQQDLDQLIELTGQTQ